MGENVLKAETIVIQTASKQYPLFIGRGVRPHLDTIIDTLNQSYSAFLVISDESVAPLYLNDVVGKLPSRHVFSHLVPSGEEAKSIDHYYACLTTALEHGLDRNSCIIALGGGVVGDLAGFVAATYMRGIAFLQLPTTLLAHDSSVGGKVAINHPLGKNMIGAFYQPDAVVYDVETLSTLPDREWRSGLAEVIKHALIWDKEWYQQLVGAIHSLDDLKKTDLTTMLRKAIAVKAEIVRQDEKEKGIRSFLNFGHTLAHAIEATYGYGKISHGEAVAIGMVFAMKISEAYYHNPLPVNAFDHWLRGLGFGTKIPSGLRADRLLEAMKKDKKALHGSIRMILLKEIGHVERVPVDDEMLYAQLQAETEGRAKRGR